MAMETLYDLLGALPNDDAQELRAAFRRAVKRVHPDINPEDRDAAVKFRRIVRANEILGDAEQRAAYDHLLALAHYEKEQVAKQAAAEKIHRLASGVMALAGILLVVVGGYALLVQLSANVLTPAIATAETARETAANFAAEYAEEGAAIASAAPQEAPERAIPSAIVPAAKTVLARATPPIGRSSKHVSKSASGHADRGSFLDRLRKFTNSFAEVAQTQRLQRANHPIKSSPPQAARAKAIRSNEAEARRQPNNPVATPAG